MAISAVLALIAGKPAAEYFREQPIIAHVEQLGGRVATASTVEQGLLTNLAARFGVPQLFERVVHVSLMGTEVGDDDVRMISELAHLEDLALTGTDITDQAMAELSRLRGLRMLDVSSTKVTNAGVRQLQSIGLSEFLMFDTEITYDSVRELNLPSVASVADRLGKDIERTKVTRSRSSQDSFDPFLMIRSETDARTLFTLLRKFGCDSAKVFLQVQMYDDTANDELLELIAHVPRITTLHLTSSIITDEGITALCANKDLTDLRIYEAKLTRACIESIKRLPNLHTLELPELAKPGDIAALKTALPGLVHLRFGDGPIEKVVAEKNDP